jgi:Intracellular proteinase inhibitor
MYGNVVLRRGGETVYAWARGHGFLQAVTYRRLGPRETYACRLGPDVLDLQPGRYEVFAYLSLLGMRAVTRRSLVVPDPWLHRGEPR